MHWSLWSRASIFCPLKVTTLLLDGSAHVTVTVVPAEAAELVDMQREREEGCVGGGTQKGWIMID